MDRNDVGRNRPGPSASRCRSNDARWMVEPTGVFRQRCSVSRTNGSLARATANARSGCAPAFFGQSFCNALNNGSSGSSPYRAMRCRAASWRDFCVGFPNTFSRTTKCMRSARFADWGAARIKVRKSSSIMVRAACGPLMPNRKPSLSRFPRTSTGGTALFLVIWRGLPVHAAWLTGHQGIPCPTRRIAASLQTPLHVSHADIGRAPEGGGHLVALPH